MEEIDTMQLNVEDLVDESYNEEYIETNLTNGVASEDIIINSSAKMVAPASGYSEYMGYDDISYSEPPAKSSSVLPLCITVIICLAAGIALGIFKSKKDANK